MEAKLVAVPLAVSVAALLTSCSTAAPPPATSTVTIATPAPTLSSPPAVAVPPVAVGEEAIDGMLAFTVKGSDTDDVVDFDEPDAVHPQGIFVIVTTQIKNIGRSSWTYSADYQRLVDGEGREFSPDTPAMRTQYLAKETRIDINPGNTAAAQLVFDVPQGTQPNQYALLLRDSPDSQGVTLSIPPPPPPRTFSPTADDDQKFLTKLASDNKPDPYGPPPIWMANPALAIRVAHDTCPILLAKRHMTASDFGDLGDQLAQRWGIDSLVAGEIVNAALTTYPNCS